MKTFVNDPYLVEIEDALSPQLCNSLIEKFNHVIFSERQKVDQLSICYRDGKKLCTACNCTRLNLMEHPIFTEEIFQVANISNQLFAQYKQITDSVPIQFPTKYTFESIKIKRYLPNTDQQFKMHIDADSWNMSKRFLAIIFYLNDGFEGGETTFIKHRKTITPKQGKCVIFPPYWPWLHKAEQVEGDCSKYFMGTYLTHVD